MVWDVGTGARAFTHSRRGGIEMDRLTEKAYGIAQIVKARTELNGKVCYYTCGDICKRQDSCRHGCPIQAILDRLAAYQDTGLTPEDLKEVQKALGKTSLNELHDILSAKQEGRLILPPCDENDYRGLKVKYRVFKVRNNEPVENCFVLRPDKDPAARAALECYANKTPNDQLAWDILKWLESMGGEKD